MEDELKNTVKVKKKNRKEQVLSWIIGDTDKWREVPNAIKLMFAQIRHDKHERIILILIGICCFTIAFGSIQGLRWVQERAQYCEVIVAQGVLVHQVQTDYGQIKGINMINGTRVVQEVNDLVPVPQSGQSYRYYLDYYEGKKKQPWVGLNCSFNFSRYKQELQGQIKND